MEINAQNKRVVWFIAMILVPVFIMSVELSITRRFGIGATQWDTVGLVVSIVVGVSCLWRSPLRTAPRIWLSIVYIPLGAALLVLYSLLFVCFAFRDCL